MKTLFRTYKYIFAVLGFLGAALILSCANNQKMAGARSGKVKITDTGIAIRQLVQMNSEDERHMKNVLRQHSAELYLIETTKNGKTTRMGKLKDTTITGAMKGKPAAEEEGVKVIISCTNPPDCINQVRLSKTQAEKESREIVDALRKTLQNY